MKDVTVEPAAVTQAAGSQQIAAEQVGQQAVAERIDTGALAGTFGLIGAGFLAAVAEVGTQRARTLDGLATAHASTSVAADRAGNAYCRCDDAGARAVAV